MEKTHWSCKDQVPLPFNDLNFMTKPKIISILGPTAIGKSDLAVFISLYLKEKYNINSEIISADSRQIYKHLDLGTGKITKEEMKGIKHHMLDIINPDQE